MTISVSISASIQFMPFHNRQPKRIWTMSTRFIIRCDLLSFS